MPPSKPSHSRQRFSVVILAGGRSVRMGRDKALLVYQGGSLLERQLQLARDLYAHEILIAARSPGQYLGHGARVLADALPGQGPLAGMERALAEARCSMVLAIAVDLPRLTVGTLNRVLEACTAGQGVIPRLDGQPEPLAACYPKTARDTLVESLGNGRNSAREFATACVQHGLARWLDLPDTARREFDNWNRPQDIQS